MSGSFQVKSAEQLGAANRGRMDQGQRIVRDLERLHESATNKRLKLFIAAQKHSRYRKWCTISAGVLALLSAATITSLIGEYAPEPAAKLIAAALALLSGLISLASSVGFKDTEVADMYTGASGYVGLREHANLALVRELPPDQRLAEHEKLVKQYVTLDSQYGRYIAEEASFKPGDDGPDLPHPRTVGSSVAPSFPSVSPVPNHETVSDDFGMRTPIRDDEDGPVAPRRGYPLRLPDDQV